ncbi:MAG: DMT family transporter [Pseudomonadota bacterium]
MPPVPHAPPSAGPASQERPFLALGLRLLAMLMASIMLLLVKLAGQHGVSLPETLFWRQFIPALAISGWVIARGRIASLKTNRPMLHARRAVLGMGTMFMILGTVRILPLAESTVLGFTMPVFAVLLSVLLLREQVGPWRWAAVLLGLAGVLVIAGPDRSHLPLPGLALGLGAALGLALVSIQVRDMGRTEQTVTIVFWFSAIGALMLAPALLVAGDRHDPWQWALLWGVGLSGLFTQLLLTSALRFGHVSSVIVMDYSQLIWAGLWGWLVFQQLPPATTWLGAPLVIAAGLIVTWREHVRRTPRRAVAAATLAD